MFFNQKSCWVVEKITWKDDRKSLSYFLWIHSDFKRRGPHKDAERDRKDMGIIMFFFSMMQKTILCLSCTSTVNCFEGENDIIIPLWSLRISLNNITTTWPRPNPMPLSMDCMLNKLCYNVQRAQYLSLILMWI